MSDENLSNQAFENYIFTFFNKEHIDNALHDQNKLRLLILYDGVYFKIKSQIFALNKNEIKISISVSKNQTKYIFKIKCDMAKINTSGHIMWSTADPKIYKQKNFVHTFTIIYYDFNKYDSDSIKYPLYQVLSDNLKMSTV